MILLLGLAASASVLHLAPVHGPVRPGEPAHLEVVVTDDRGRPVSDVVLTPNRGEILREEPPAPWVTGWTWTPPDRAGPVVFTATWSGGTASATLLVEERPSSRLSVPARVDVAAGSAWVTDLGPGGPPPEALALWVSEPADTEVRRTADGTIVTVTPRGVGARNVLVALADRRVDEEPALVRIRVVERPALSVQLEPDATLTVRMGGRTYGPFRADGSGRVRPVIEQRPGETQAELVVSDALGNTLVTPYLLSGRASPALVAFTTREPSVSGPPPGLVLAAVGPEGSWWRGARPRCLLAGAGEVALRDRAEGTWHIPLPYRPLGPRETRVECELGDVKISPGLRPDPSAPAGLDLRVWPEEVSTDFPVSEVTVHVLDASGERVGGGEVAVSAALGQVTLEPGAASRRGEYRGNADAVREGRDTVVATLRLPPGSGVPARLLMGHGSAVGGQLGVHARAVDTRGLPLRFVPVRLWAGEREVTVATDDQGWARILLPWGGGAGVVGATAGAAAANLAIPPAPDARGPTPGAPDLRAERTVRLSTGRVGAVRIESNPPQLRYHPSAVATLRVWLYDRSENLVTDEVPQVTADAGSLGPPRRQPDGAYEVLWTPPPDGRARTVTIEARAPGGGASSQLRIFLEPRPVRLAIGASAGGLTNFGRVNSAVFAADVDVRATPAPAIFVRFGAAGYTVGASVETEVGTEVKRLTLVPITAGAQARADRGATAGWAGLGAVFAPFYATSTFDDVRLPARLGALPPGFGVWVGGARRAGVGEVSVELRGTFLVSAGGNSGFVGQVGGLGLQVGYRFTIE